VYQNSVDLSPVGRNEIASNGTVQGRLYRGDPQNEPVLVAAEDQRIELVRTMSASVPWRIEGVDGPYRIPTSPATTLVLTARSAPYTVADLQRLAPKTFVRQPDGSFLLSENVVALPGVTLDFSSATPVTIALLSTPGKFVSIVTIGGGVTAAGTAEAPVTFVSRDPATGGPDTMTNDGRAYVRIIGGPVNLKYAAFSDLGFWSGDTGGLALTGVEAPTAPPPPADSATRGQAGAPTLSADQLAALTAETQLQPGYVSGTVDHVTTTGNAFGLFITRATGITLSNSSISNSLIDGIVLHRWVTQAKIESSQTMGNAVDGLSIARSSGSVAITALTASQNGRNGVSIDGRPLADGPSATGTPTDPFGNIQVSDSTISDNARYGIEVSGAHGTTVTGSTVSGNEVGVVLHHEAANVRIVKNKLDHQHLQAVAISGGVTDTDIEGNRISSVDTGVRIAGGTATVERNSFTGISRHAVTLADRVSGTRVTGNTIQGLGTTPIHDDAAGGYVADNNVDEWKQPVTARSILNTLGQPLTLVWVTLGLLVVFTALTGHRRRDIRNPFADRVPLTELSAGIVSPEELRGQRS